jgi:Leucine-rich repeat (LRR) protein
MIFATNKHGQPQQVVLSDKPIATGGESEIFEIKTGLADSVAKCFLPKYRTDAKRDKINYLIQNNPNQLGDKDVIWPTHSLWENGQFIGFIMPKAEGDKLELLCSPTPTGKNLDRFLQKYPHWQRFLLTEPQGLQLRLKLCYNLLAAVEKLHKTNLYVIVDLKPDNILIQPNGLVTIIDTDSLQVATETLFYPANVCTPEYTPAEFYQGLKFNTTIVPISWDYFSLAVLLYRLLLGLHPFTASCKGQYAHCTSVDELIKNELLPLLPQMAQHFHTIPPPHTQFYQLPLFIQNYLLASLQQAQNRPALSQIIPKWYQWLLNPASRQPTSPINIEWWNSLDDVWFGDVWKSIFEKATGSTPNQVDFFQKIENLTELECRSKYIISLEPLRNLTNLTKLYCNSTQIISLEPLGNLTNLTVLDCRNTQISSLKPLRNLTNLTELSCYNTQISSLEPLRNLTNLTELNCGGNFNNRVNISSLEPLRELKNLTVLKCNSTNISSLEPLQNLTNLTELNCGGDYYNVNISSLEPLRNLTNLTKLDCSNRQISSLEPLQNLTNLTKLSCGDTQISSLEPLQNLTNLTELYCSNRQISSLEPLQNLTNLTELHCSNTKISSLEPLRNLTNLTELDCSNTKISSLEPLKNLTNLTKLWCKNTQISSLEPLKNLTNLTKLNCSYTQISSLEKAVFRKTHSNCEVSF